jgi:hypothetical protein
MTDRLDPVMRLGQVSVILMPTNPTSLTYKQSSKESYSSPFPL